MMPLAWNWIRKNVDLILLLTAIFCLALALGEVIRGSTWSLLMPISLSAALCGWRLGVGHLEPKQAWGRLTALGIPAVFIYVGGLIRPLGRLALSIFSLIPQLVMRLTDKIPIDASAVSITWTEFTGHFASLVGRLWGWSLALVAGESFMDPLAAGIMWSILLWLICAWAGWRIYRDRQALQALAPGCILLALVLDYSHGEVGLLIVYLAILLALMGLTQDVRRHVDWMRRRMDYSESVRLDTLLMVGMVTIALTLSAAGTPSLSWRDLVEKFRSTDRTGADQVAESLGLEHPANVASSEAYRSNGLPREHLMNSSPEQLQDVVMTVSTGEIPPMSEVVTEIEPNRYYWRMITYDVYSGVGWSSTQAQETPLTANTSILEFPAGYRSVTQQIRRVSNQNTYVYWTGILAQADAKLQIAWRAKPPADPTPVWVGDMLGALTTPDEYTVVSYLPQFSAEQLRNADTDYPQQITARYLRLPEETPERVLALSRELTQAAPTPYDRAVAIESYLRAFPYTLDVEPPPLDRDVVDYFLFTAQQGYCDFYSTSMVVLARAAGLPAREVIGYTSGEYDAPTAEYIVRQENAHSWAEVYFSGIGWVEFEPTASQPAIDRVNNTGSSNPPPSLPGGPSAFSWLKTKWRALFSSLSGQILIAGVGFVLLFILWQMGEVGFLYLIPSRRAVARIYSRMKKTSVHLLTDLPDGHTPHQLGAALAHKLQFEDGQNQIIKGMLSKAEAEINQVVSIYESQVFSEHQPTSSQVSQGILAWSRLRWRLWIVNRLKLVAQSQP
ncbi:MAG: transglutaminase domain-containing protein [Anaerolineales bacterium]|jgi:transglutaminase-like putative cysteine protease